MNNDSPVPQFPSSSIPPRWLGIEAPRYTSYPTAHHFSPQVNADIYSSWLSSIAGDAEVSIYVHIPFCAELCWFCGCHTKITNHYAPISRYVQALLREIEIVKQHKGQKGKFINIHFGGGSPSILTGEDMQAVMDSIASLFAGKPGGEVAIELDPRTTTKENIKLYKDLGFNRISLGIQDFDEQVQIAINRVQPYALVSRVVSDLREAGFDNINFDFIYGLPKQTLAGFMDTLDKSIALNPSRIALFSYAHVPSVKKHQNLINVSDLPSDAEKLAIYEASCKKLEEAGYIAIGIDHFAKPDDELAIAMNDGTLRRNFQGYVTDKTDTLIGVGVSAISQFPQGYAQATTNSLDYRTSIESGKLPVVRGYALTDGDRVRKAVIDSLMCFLRVDLNMVQREYGLPDNYFAAITARLQKPEYAEISSFADGVITVSDKHKMAARLVASLFDEYLGLVQKGRASKVS